MKHAKLPKRHLLVTIVAATLAGSSVARADESRERDMEEARRQFQAGVNLLDDPDGAKYEEAYSAFKKAYALSQSPKVLGNLGFCAMHLERDGEAIEAYTRYLTESLDVSERERAQIQKDVATLSSTAVRLRVVVKRAAVAGASFVLVDTRAQTRGASVENTYAFESTETVIRVRPGRHTLKVKFNGEESLPVEAMLEPASQAIHELAFAPKPAEPGPTVVPKSPSLAGPVALGVTGLLALGVGTVTGVIAQNKTGAIQSRCPNDVCPPEYDLASARGSAKTFGTVADIAFIGGGALVGTALLWYVLLPSSRKPTTGGSTRPIANATCTHDGCGLSLQGGF